MLTMHPVPVPHPPPRKSIPLHSGDIEVIIPANDTGPTQPILRPLSTEQATVIIDREAEIIDLVRKAIASMMPPPPKTDHGASMRWLLVGLITGSIIIYVLMAGALYDTQVALAQARANGGSPPPVFTTSPVVLSAPASTCSTTASAIPTIDVEKLPRHTTFAPRVAAPKATTPVDEENPYEDVSPE